ncbi:hypothetical protein V6N13_113883 [Hibiscus sabdariffa]
MPQPAPAKKNVAPTSTATPQTRPPALEEHADPAIPHTHAPASTPRPSAKNTTATRRTLTKKDKGKAHDDDNDEDMPDVPQPPAPKMETSIPRRCLKRKANRNISTTDLAAEENVASDAEDDGSSTTLEETPMTSPPQSKACYKGVASKPTPKQTRDGSTYQLGGEMFAPCSSRVYDGMQVQGLRIKRCCSISGRMLSILLLQHWCTRGHKKENDKGCTCPNLHVDF